VFKRIDTCAAEFASPHRLYVFGPMKSPFAGEFADESGAVRQEEGSSSSAADRNRIGQGIEFDYCCCHACFALHDAGYETIMINCNPENGNRPTTTTADRLYFRTADRRRNVLEIISTERKKRPPCHGVIVQFRAARPR